MTTELTKDRLVELVVAALPGPLMIKDLDTTSEMAEIRFTWRHVRFRVSNTLHVDEVDGHLLKGSTAAALMSALLREVRVNRLTELPL